MPRLDHLLARNLGTSRARARAAIAAGEIFDAAAGTALTDPRLDIAPPREITRDGQPLLLRDRFDLLLNKPAGCVTALTDRRHPTAYALLRGAPLFDELRPVGRLDLDTTGLLLWTTDGDWLHALTHPRRQVPRTYQAALARPLAPAATPPALTLADGHQPQILELSPLAPAELHPSLVRCPEAAAHARIAIVGGAYHEVRRIFAALGNHVLALCRVGFGRLTLPRDLAPGAHRPIDPHAV